MFKTLQDFQEHKRKMDTDPEYANQFMIKQEDAKKDHWNELKPFKKAEDVPNIPHVTNKDYHNFYIPP